jgi:hypothetical protein
MPASMETGMAAGRRPILTGFTLSVLLLTAVLWAGFVGNATTLTGSDPAGNALTQAFAFLLGLVVWALLAVLLLIAGIAGKMPWWAKLAAFVLHPASCCAALATLSTLSHSQTPASWPLVVPILAPPLMLAYAVWAYFPALGAGVPGSVAGGATWGGVLILSLLPWPFILHTERALRERQAHFAAEQAAEQGVAAEKEQREWAEKLDKLPKNAPLWEWQSFTDRPELHERALEGIRHLDRRQADAEDMLAHGLAFPMRELPSLDLQITPGFCRSARAFLNEQLKGLSPPVPDRPYDWENAHVDPYLPGMEWLQDHGCDCSAEVAASEAGVRAYPQAADRDRTLASLARLRHRR